MEFEIKSESLETLENIKVVISKVTLRKVSESKKLDQLYEGMKVIAENRKLKRVPK